MIRHDMRGTWATTECTWCKGRGYQPDPTLKNTPATIPMVQPCPHCEGTGIQVKYDGGTYPGGNSPLSWATFEYRLESSQPRRWTMHWRLAYLWDE